ncbi:MAG: RNA 2',3'-cyclic phosphodiesterase [Patescibacteria group bacterium]
MRHRIFIAINLPENVKKQLCDLEYKWLELPCRWTKKENLHITLAFLGEVTDEELPGICRITGEVASRHEPFFISLNKAIYGPPGKNPRMVWIEGKVDEKLTKLHKDLEKSLYESISQSDDDKGRPYALHITLGRLKQWEFQKIELEERPEINEDIDLNFEVKSLEVMESNLGKEGPQYAVLGSAPLITNS